MSEQKDASRHSKDKGDDDVNSFTTDPAPKTGIIAIPVSKISYTEIPEGVRSDYREPGGPIPIGDPDPDDGCWYHKKGQKKKGDKNYETYDVYTFEIYRYNTWDEYKLGKDRSERQVKDKDAPRTFQFSFNAQLWDDLWYDPDAKNNCYQNCEKRFNESKPPCFKEHRPDNCKCEWLHSALQPGILQEAAREVAIFATEKAGKDHSGFAIALYSIFPNGASKGAYMRKKRTKKGIVIQTPSLKYGKKTEKRPDGQNFSPDIGVHNYGPSGSTGCATTPLKKYTGKGRSSLYEFEQNMQTWMELSNCKYKQKRDTKTGIVYPNPIAARIVLPGTSESYPSPPPKPMDFSNASVGDMTGDLNLEAH